MNVLILHDVISPDARVDELDALVQADVVTAALARLGHQADRSAFSLDLAGATNEIRRRRPDLAFNLVESVEGQGRLIYLAPALLSNLGVPYTGAQTEAMFVTSNKVLTKQVLAGNGIPTPPWCSHTARASAATQSGARVSSRQWAHRRDAGATKSSGATASYRDPTRSSIGTTGGPAVEPPLPGRYIVKSVWEDASLGLEDDSVVVADTADGLRREVAARSGRLGGEAFAELYIEGREFNLSLLAAPGGPQVLPPAEIRFVDYADDRPKLVGYRAKWDEKSFEYHHTPRSFDFPAADGALLKELERLALSCWDLLGLNGYARVDFRVDGSGQPWVLEVNANPCLSPDAGFAAAAARADLRFDQVVARILADCPAPVRGAIAR